LKHENIIEMLDSFESAQEFCVVTEFAQVIISFLISQKHTKKPLYDLKSI
jgi:hypothetical protein